MTLHAFLILWHWMITQEWIVLTPAPRGAAGTHALYEGNLLQACALLRSLYPHVWLQVVGPMPL